MIGVPIFISNTTSNLSSSSIDDFILISNPEVLNKEIIGNNKLIGGCPGKILREDISWEM